MALAKYLEAYMEQNVLKEGNTLLEDKAMKKMGFFKKKKNLKPTEISNLL